MFKFAPYSPKFADMNKNCPVCGFDLEQEPQFYFGAMYFSYAFQVAIFVAVYLGLRFTINPEVNTYIIVMAVAVVAMLPLNFRWSRAAWISLFASYKEHLN
jgi:uncharacterized protein (DUF983 family)